MTTSQIADTLSGGSCRLEHRAPMTAKDQYRVTPPALFAEGDEMDVTIRVTWSDGSVTSHSICGMPCDDIEVVEETLNHGLADYLVDGWPTDADGLLLGWVWVEVVD